VKRPGEEVPPEGRVKAGVGLHLVEAVPGKVPAGQQIRLPGEDKVFRRWQPGDRLEPGKVRPHRVEKEFRRLAEGDEVVEGQLVALIDPTITLNEAAIKVANLEASESERRAAEKTKGEAQRRVTAMDKLRRTNPRALSEDDYWGGVLTAQRYGEEEVAKQTAVVKTQQELIQTAYLLDMHEVRSGVRGTIAALVRSRGEVVKQLETVLRIRPAGRPARRATTGPDPGGPAREVRGERDGVLLFIGTEIKPGEKVPPGRVVTAKVGAETRQYRRLQEGDRVEEGQLLARLDDRLARVEVAIKREDLPAWKAESRAASKTRDEAERRVAAMEKLNRNTPGAVSAEDYEGARLTARRYAEEVEAKAAAVRRAEAELRHAEALLAAYEVRSPWRGVVRSVDRYPGEAVGAGALILRVVPDGPGE
jgi:multidrug resistance efflux pump